MTGSEWPATVLAAGAVISIFSVTLVTLYGQTRILFAMGRDGMVPPLFHRLNPRTLTPVPTTIIVAFVVSVLAGVLPIDFLAEMTSIGTLVAFLVVSVGVMVLRRTAPDLPRGFRVPLYPLTPILSIAGCIWIIQDLRAVTIYVFFAWATVALAWYFFYGRRHSELGRLETAGRGHTMTMVVGVTPDRRGRPALHLAALLARSADDDLVLCTVIPTPWPPSPAKVDAEYRAELERVANEALVAARARIPADIPATTLIRPAHSVPAGLLEVAEEHDARVLIAGSSSAGAFGRVALGSVSSHLVHSSPMPVALPPRGYHTHPEARATRVTAAYGGPESSDDLVVAAAEVAGRVGASLRLASFAVRSRPPYTSGVGSEAEHAMIEQWVKEIEAAGRAALDRVRDLPKVPPTVETVIGYGESWEEALEDVEWQDGDVLAVGSSAVGPVARVFLGSRASKIVRNSPVPVVVVPRPTAADLAGRAAQADATSLGDR